MDVIKPGKNCWNPERRGKVEGELAQRMIEKLDTAQGGFLGFGKSKDGGLSRAESGLSVDAFLATDQDGDRKLSKDEIKARLMEMDDASLAEFEATFDRMDLRLEEEAMGQSTGGLLNTLLATNPLTAPFGVLSTGLDYYHDMSSQARIAGETQKAKETIDELFSQPQAPQLETNPYFDGPVPLDGVIMPSDGLSDPVFVGSGGNPHPYPDGYKSQEPLAE